MQGAGITAVVLTLNEAEHLPDCLRSLRPLTRRVIVLDCGSTDGTRNIATDAGVELQTRPFDGYASQRNAALALLGDAEWMLFIDADERLTSSGVAEIREAIDTAAADLSVFWLPRRNMFFGREIRGGGWWPDEQARLLKRGHARFDPSRQVHEVVVHDGASRRLREPMIHLNYATRREFIAKQRAYSLQRVAHASASDPPRRRAMIGAPMRELWRRVIRLRGYRDGVTGLFLAGVLAFEEARVIWLLRAKARHR